MINPGERLKYLFHKFYAKQASEEETKELFRLLELRDEEELTSLLKEVWHSDTTKTDLFDEQKSEVIFNRVLEESRLHDNVIPIASRNTFNIFRYIAVAASVLVFLIIGIYITRDQTGKKIKPEAASIIKERDFTPGGNKAVLTLGNGSTIVLDDIKTGILSEQNDTKIRKTEDGQLVYIAKENGVEEPVPVINTITTPRGGEYRVILPDGSKVWLNAASSLSFPTHFTGKERRVECKGEVYFEVAKNPSMPFIVKVNRTEVKVLGTHFNIMAYEDEDALKTTLIEGSVQVLHNNSKNILAPGDQAVINRTGTVKVKSNVNVSEVIAWQKGLFEFKSAGIESIMRQMSRWYDVEVSYRGQVPVRQFTGKISRNVKASELLKMLEYAGVNFKIEGKTIVLYGNNN
jgi:hypothetical protein